MTTLLTIQHDPQGKLLEPFHKVLPLLNGLFQESYIVVTTDTHGDYNLLPWKVRFREAKGMAQARLDVIEYALEGMADDYYFYCDLDRLVHWVSRFPSELESVAALEGDYTIIGRTAYAFNSHPSFQRETERIMNIICDKMYYSLNMDFFAGARIMSLQAAKWISEQSIANRAAQDIEWPLIVSDNGSTLEYVEVDGLGFEGNDRSKEDDIALRLANLKSVVGFVE